MSSGLTPSTSSDTAVQRSDTTPLASAASPRAPPSTTGACASAASPLSLYTRTCASRDALPSHAPCSTKSFGPARRSLQRVFPPPLPTGYAVAAGLRFGQVSTETPRSRLMLGSAFRRSNGGRSTPFPIKEEPERVATSSLSPSRSRGRTSSQVGTLLPPTRAPFWKSAIRSAGPFFLDARGLTCATFLQLQWSGNKQTLSDEPVTTSRPAVR